MVQQKFRYRNRFLAGIPPGIQKLYVCLLRLFTEQPEMRHNFLYGIAFFLCVCLAHPAKAQLQELAAGLLNAPGPTGQPVTFSDSIHRQDSIKLQEMELRLQEMELHKIVLQSKLDSTLQFSKEDSLRRQRQISRIDSLRKVTPGFPVIVDNDTLFMLYAQRRGVSTRERVHNISATIEQLGKSFTNRKDSLYVFESEYVSDLMCGQTVICELTDQDALWQNTPRQKLAADYLSVISEKIKSLREEHSLLSLAKRIFFFLLVIAIQYVLFVLTAYVFKKLKRRIVRLQRTRLRPISIREYEVLPRHRQARILLFLSNILRYTAILLQLMVSVPILFSIFPQTEDLARRIFSYMLAPVKLIVSAVVNYIPNLFIIVAIYFCIRYIIKGLRYMANEIESERLKISGFYPDWAQPTYNIIRFLLYAFMIAMIYPYLPGSNSGVFQGISVFVGLIVSLGSSAVIGNIIAGLVITYMRPFKVGDRIKLNETVGNVIEKTPFVTRIRTPKNEVVTIPNSFIMSSHTTNYSSSARNYGLIIHSTVTIGYDTPWRKVHRLLIEAAKMTHGISSDPEPFVLETELSDFYPVYQINAFIRDADRLPRIYSELHQHIQDVFNKAGVEIMSPHYRAERDGNEVTIPKSAE